MKRIAPLVFGSVFLFLFAAFSQERVSSPDYPKILHFGKLNIKDSPSLNDDAKVVCDAVEAKTEELYKDKALPSKEKARNASINLLTAAWYNYRIKNGTTAMPQAAFLEYSRHFTYGSVISTPSNALIKFNGDEKGHTNLDFLGVEMGHCDYELILEEYQTATGSIEIDKPYRIERTLIKK